mmetsp:Transcript_9799/g.19248  ORF Transcript_9799/g.19248 Transcript_9799/m.19248 type:complete len:415 (-) Transcript_9799:896-2140(-)
MDRRRSRSPQRWSGGLNPLTGREFSHKYHNLLRDRRRLPIFEALPKLKQLLTQNRIVVLQGETGSGKTTQVPSFLVEEGIIEDKAVACTQPRRVAAMSVAKRVAEEMDVTLGEHVGYSIRFEDCCSKLTKVKYLTDGMLLREAMSDPELNQYKVVVLDEAHERTLATDILFGLLKELVQKRDDLKLIVMSATMDTERFKEYFEGAPLLSVPGRMYKVEVMFTPRPEPDYFAAVVRTIVQIHGLEPPGDILVFLTGEEEIENCCKAVKRELSRYGESVGKLSMIPLYSSLPPSSQQKIFEPRPPPNSRNIAGRKCIIATNIAETSITVDGVVYVVDSGLSKQKVRSKRANLTPRFTILALGLSLCWSNQSLKPLRSKEQEELDAHSPASALDCTQKRLTTTSSNPLPSLRSCGPT